MKRILSLIIILSLLMTSPILPVFAGDTDVVEGKFWGDNFESYSVGEKPYAYPDFYNSSAQKRPDDWTGVADGITVQKESDYIDNKLVRVSNSGDATSTFSMSKYTEVDELGGNRDFTVSFRTRTDNNDVYVRFLQYGGEGGSIDAISIKGGAAYTGGTYITDVETDKWLNVRINIILSQLKMEIFIDDEMVYYGNAGNDDAGGYSVSFNSSVAPGASAYWDDFMFVNYTAQTDAYVENNLETYMGVHPRLFYEEKDFEQMRQKTQNEFSDEFEHFISKADELCERGPLEYWVDSNTEELWMRDEADNIRYLSFIYKLTGNPKYKQAATDFVNMAISYPSWGRGDVFCNKDLSCAHMLVGFSCYYDWLYHDLTADERYAARNIIAERAAIISRGAWWSKSYIQNHLWNAASGCLTAAVALYDEIPQAQKWADAAHNWYKKTFYYLGEDGANHESLMYWNYGLSFMNYYLRLANKFYNIDYTDHGYIQNTSKYAHCMMDPNGFYSVRFADYNGTFDLSYIAELAYLNTLCTDEHQKKINQWFINKYYNMASDEQKAEEILLAYYDKNAESISPQDANYSNETFFDDLGLFFTRTAWDGEDVSFVAYRCGPTVGKKLQIGITGFDPGSDHVHSDVNSPQIYTRGENILDESQYYGFLTASHNTLLVNNIGQYGEGEFFSEAPKGYDANPQIVKITSDDGIVYSVADATEIYDAERTGLKKFVRHFIYIKPDILIMVDDIETKESETPIPLELRFFPVVQNASAGVDGSYSFVGEKCSYEINPIILADSAESECVTVAKELTKGTIANRTVVRVKSDNQTLVQPTVISWTDKDKKPEKVTCEEKDGIYYFYTNNEIIKFNLNDMEVSREKINKETKIKIDGKLVDNKVEPELRNNRLFVLAEDVPALSGGAIKYDQISDNEFVFSNGSYKTIMKLNEKTYEQNGNIIENDTAPYKGEYGIMVPVRAVGLGFGIDCKWESDISTLRLTSNVDFSDAGLKTVSASGVSVDILEDTYDYELTVFEDQRNLSVVPNIESSGFEIKYPETIFGKAEITVISPNKLVEKVYSVTFKPYYGIGNVPIYKMGYSTCDGNVGENVLDGDFGTRWSASGDGQYLWYDLGHTTKLKSVLVSFYSGDSRKAYFDIQVSDDGINWTTVKECISSGTTLEAEEYLIQGTQARYVRFFGHGAGAIYGSGWNSVTELGIIGME